MSKNEKKAENVVTIERCCSEGCGKRSARANFCDEHYSWFKMGLVTTEGKKAKDFEKKFQQMQARKAS